MVGLTVVNIVHINVQLFMCPKSKDYSVNMYDGMVGHW
jgi:hypothetical protein